MKIGQPSLRVLLNPVAVWGLLEKRGISQNRLAQLCGISSGYMSQLVCGTRRPSLRVQRRIRQVLGWPDLDDLFMTQPIDP